MRKLSRFIVCKKLFDLHVSWTHSGRLTWKGVFLWPLEDRILSEKWRHICGQYFLTLNGMGKLYQKKKKSQDFYTYSSKPIFKSYREWNPSCWLESKFSHSVWRLWQILLFAKFLLRQNLLHWRTKSYVTFVRFLNMRNKCCLQIDLSAYSWADSSKECNLL